MSIQITETAKARMHSFLVGHPEAVGVRFGVRKTGCSGYAYTVDLTNAIADNDHVFDEGDLRVVVDAKSLPFIDGTEIDFARQGLNASFVFRNPNSTGECGCGESFTVEDQA